MTQHSAHSRETHAAFPWRFATANEAPPTCTKSTVIVDVIYAESPTSSETAIRPFEAANERERNATDHVYEEVGLFNEFEDEFLNHHQRNSLEADGKLTMPTMRCHKICAQCLRSRGSPVIYSDRLIYEKQQICAVETRFFQELLSTRQIYFRHDSPRAIDSLAFLPTKYFCKYVGDYMPVSNLTKANASGILCCSPPLVEDVFDLDSSLAPNISLLNGTENIGLTNTQIYHRIANNCYSRISQNEASAPMIFRIKSSRMFSTIKSTGYDENMIYWMNYESDLRKHHREAKSGNRSSLLLLEPLLLMPELANSRQNTAKNHITHSERVKIVRMVIAYTLSFFLLAIVTFYIVYFT